ncbi:S1-like domain-containing RNA-binding protein [Ruminococcus sp. OA3]|uniref:CvfB family protein n=1 Tax=Ruminococcus sp. OA3 TaxID=2914164 RepID=UPI001F06AA08|nr:S1-like domain-containing RNA-binding protein [Ruminococcus sp. OA3]MCH1981667.1 S1-like domain-containing RNA-binding protein [Ruminococcus sp. OA3]
MIQIGKKQKLIIVKTVDFGVYLAENREEKEAERVLLPKKQVPQGAKTGDELEVFIYRDSSDRPIATVNEPVAQLNKTAVFKVSDVGKIGAFLDWGLEKDLLLPFREQTKKVRPGEEVLAAVYLDKSSRLCATMKVYHYLKTNSPYVIGDEAEGRVYEISDNFGVFVAVDDQYSGLIPKQEAQGTYRVGDTLKLRVTAVKEDGKLNLTAQKKAYLQMDEDAEAVFRVIEEFAGVLPFDDKASPEVIKREFGLSKAAFKRAVGHLLKEKKAAIRDGKIYILK